MHRSIGVSLASVAIAVFAILAASSTASAQSISAFHHGAPAVSAGIMDSPRHSRISLDFTDRRYIGEHHAQENERLKCAGGCGDDIDPYGDALDDFADGVQAAAIITGVVVGTTLVVLISRASDKRASSSAKPVTGGQYASATPSIVPTVGASSGGGYIGAQLSF